MPELKEEDIQLRSEEVQEILTHIPSWLIRWGITLVFFIVGLLVAGSWYIKYPEIILSKVSIVTENPPVKLVSQSNGKIKLLVKDKATVTYDTYLGIIENQSNADDVSSLKRVLDSQLALLSENIDSLKLNTDTSLQLGDLQTDYSVLKQNYLNFHYFLKDNYYQGKIAAIQSQYKQYLNLNEKLISQKETLNKELELIQKKHNNNKALYKDGVIAEIDLSNSESEYLQKKYTAKNAEITLVNNQIQLDESKKTMMDLEQQFVEKKRLFIVSLQESYKQLLASIGAWEQRYVLKTTIDGVVSYSKPYTDGQFVTANEDVLTVVPGENNIIAKAYIPTYGSGKVKPGQRVNIKLDSYPFKEFGLLEGKVENISLVPINDMYMVNVSLPKGLKTNYNKQLEFKQQMSGTAEIITKDLRLIERIFNQLNSVLKRST